MKIEQVQTFLTKVKSEIEVIKNCRTDAGLIERISERLLPMLRNHPNSLDIIRNWESAIKFDNEELDTLARRGCEELTFAFKEIWDEFVSKPLKAFREGKPTLISYTINGVNPNRFLAGIARSTCEGSVCCYVEPPIKIAFERLENMYCDRIARSWDVCFAPHAYRYLQRTLQREVTAKLESLPHSAWKQLDILARAWSLRTECLRVGGGRVHGKKTSRLYRSHQADCKARFNYFAEDLKHCDKPDRKNQIFHREYTHNVLDKLFFELDNTLHEAKPLTLKIPSKDALHGRTKEYREDLEVLVPLCEEIIRSHKSLGMNLKKNDLIPLIRSSIEEKMIVLNHPTDTRIKEAIIQARSNIKGKKREIKSRKKAGQPKRALKTTSQNKNGCPNQKNER